MIEAELEEPEPTSAPAPSGPASPCGSPSAEQVSSSPPASERPPQQTRATAASARAPGAGASAPSGDAVVRFGRSKGQRLADVSELRDLEWYRDALAANVDDPAKSRWKADNVSHLREVVAHIESRDEGRAGGAADAGGRSGAGGDDFEAAGRVRGHDDDIPF